MDICNQQVFHKKFGVGTVMEQTDNSITVKFLNVEKRFQYPSAFQNFLDLNNKILQEEILKEAKRKEQKKRTTEKNIRNKILKKDLTINQTSKNLQASQDRCNIVFKCNYCDGGKSNILMGFNGVC